VTLGRIRLLPDALLSVPVFSLTFVWAVVVQFGEGAGAGDGIGDIAVRLSLLFTLQVIMFSFPYLTWRVVCPHAPAGSWTWLLGASVVVGAAVRGVVFGLLLFLIGVTDSPNLVFRVAASVGHMAVITVILWFLVSEVRGLHTRRRHLLADRDQLIDLQQVTQRDLELLGDRATDEIRRSVLESLGGLRVSDSSDLRERLRRTIDNVVRPLSHQLAAQPPEWAPPQQPIQTMRVNWPQAVREGLDPTRIHPVLITLLLIWLGLPGHFFQLGPPFAARLISTGIVVIPSFWLARRAAIRLTTHRDAGAKAVAFVIAVLVGGVALGFATLPYMRDQPTPLIFVIVAPIFAMLISAPLAIAEAARDQDLALESELRATTEDLRWMLTRAREHYRQRERTLAHALHGSLQASLAAAFLRLDRAVANGTDDKPLLASLQDEVFQAVNNLDLRGVKAEPIDKVIELTQSNWSGAIHLNFTIDPLARESLEFDRLCARSVNDLVPELVFNSVRHGRAHAIDVQLQIADFRTLSLTVIDDGSDDLITTRYGLGSALLDEASLNWSRTRLGNRTTTRCLLPVLSPSPE
jgi:signal transduction histidine kinase